MSEKQPEQTETFEEALAKLEGIVRDMETGQMDLEKMTGAFEEGTRLIRFCTQRLNAVEKRVEQLIKDKDSGEITTAPFDSESSNEANG